MANSKLSSKSITTHSAAAAAANSVAGKENSNPPPRNVDTIKSITMTSAKDNIARKDNKVSTTNEGSSLLDAIINKKTVSLSVPQNHNELCGDDCNCADPILEIIESDDDENNSVYDAIDDDDDNDCSIVADEAIPMQKSVLAVDSDSDDDSIQLVSARKTPRKKTFILDSDDDEEDVDESSVNDSPNNLQKRGAKVIDELSDFSPSSGDESEDSFTSDRRSAPVTRRSNPTRRSKAAAAASFLLNNNVTSDSEDDIDDDDKSSSSEEEEWDGEMLSDEQDAEKPRNERVNTVIILSDDDEYDSESDVEEDEQSAFTISDDDDDDDSDCSSDSDDSGARRKVPSTPPPTRKNKTSKQKTLPKEVTKDSQTKNFSKTRVDMASQTFAEFNQLAFAGQLSSVKVEWSKKLNTTAGITRMKGKLGSQHANTRVATIELATKVIDNEEQLRSTLLHEMCHAAAWLVDGVHKPPHGKVFKQWASKSMRKIKDVKVTTTHDYEIKYKYQWACTNAKCNVIIKRHSRSVDPTKHCCGKCKNKLIEIEVPGKGEDVSNNAFTPKKQRPPTEFALFVKKHSASIREKLAKEMSCSSKEVRQADVMKECGKVWQQHKKQRSSNNDIDGLGSELINLTLG